MADSSAPGESPIGESLAKREPELPQQDPIVSRSSSGWMLACALLMTISIAWALYDEAFGQRPWKSNAARVRESLHPLPRQHQRQVRPD